MHSVEGLTATSSNEDSVKVAVVNGYTVNVKVCGVGSSNIQIKSSTETFVWNLTVTGKNVDATSIKLVDNLENPNTYTQTGAGTYTVSTAYSFAYDHATETTAKIVLTATDLSEGANSVNGMTVAVDGISVTATVTNKWTISIYVVKGGESIVTISDSTGHYSWIITVNVTMVQATQITIKDNAETPNVWTLNASNPTATASEQTFTYKKEEATQNKLVFTITDDTEGGSSGWCAFAQSSNTSVATVTIVNNWTVNVQIVGGGNATITIKDYGEQFTLNIPIVSNMIAVASVECATDNYIKDSTIYIVSTTSIYWKSILSNQFVLKDANGKTAEQGADFSDTTYTITWTDVHGEFVPYSTYTIANLTDPSHARYGMLYASKQIPATGYYKFKLTFTFNGSDPSNPIVKEYYIVVTRSLSEVVNLLAQSESDLAFSTTTDLDAGDNTTSYAITIKNGKYYDKLASTATPDLVKDVPFSATYSSSNTDVVTVNSSTGVINAVGAGTATITATYTIGGEQKTHDFAVSVAVKSVTESSIKVKDSADNDGMGEYLITGADNNVGGTLSVNLKYECDAPVKTAVWYFSKSEGTYNTTLTANIDGKANTNYASVSASGVVTVYYALGDITVYVDITDYANNTYTKSFVVKAHSHSADLSTIKYYSSSAFSTEIESPSLDFDVAYYGKYVYFTIQGVAGDGELTKDGLTIKQVTIKVYGDGHEIPSSYLQQSVNPSKIDATTLKVILNFTPYYYLPADSYKVVVTINDHTFTENEGAYTSAVKTVEIPFTMSDSMSSNVESIYITDKAGNTSGTYSIEDGYVYLYGFATTRNGKPITKDFSGVSFSTGDATVATVGNSYKDFGKVTLVGAGTTTIIVSASDNTTYCWNGTSWAYLSLTATYTITVTKVNLSDSSVASLQNSDGQSSASIDVNDKLVLNWTAKTDSENVSVKSASVSVVDSDAIIATCDLDSKTVTLKAVKVCATPVTVKLTLTDYADNTKEVTFTVSAVNACAFNATANDIYLVSNSGEFSSANSQSYKYVSDMFNVVGEYVSYEVVIANTAIATLQGTDQIKGLAQGTTTATIKFTLANESVVSVTSNITVVFTMTSDPSYGTDKLTGNNITSDKVATIANGTNSVAVAIASQSNDSNLKIDRVAVEFWGVSNVKAIVETYSGAGDKLATYEVGIDERYNVGHMDDILLNQGDAHTYMIVTFKTADGNNVSADLAVNYRIVVLANNGNSYDTGHELYSYVSGSYVAANTSSRYTYYYAIYVPRGYRAKLTYSQCQNASAANQVANYFNLYMANSKKASSDSGSTTMQTSTTHSEQKVGISQAVTFNNFCYSEHYYDIGYGYYVFRMQTKAFVDIKLYKDIDVDNLPADGNIALSAESEDSVGAYITVGSKAMSLTSSKNLVVTNAQTGAVVSDATNLTAGNYFVQVSNPDNVSGKWQATVNVAEKA